MDAHLSGLGLERSGRWRSLVAGGRGVTTSRLFAGHVSLFTFMSSYGVHSRRRTRASVSVSTIDGVRRAQAGLSGGPWMCESEDDLLTAEIVMKQQVEMGLIKMIVIGSLD